MMLLLLVLLLLASASATTVMAEEAPSITGKYFELELQRFPVAEQDRFYIQFGTVNTAWPRSLAIAPRDGNAFFHMKIFNHQLHVINATHSVKLPLPKTVNAEMEYRFENRVRGRDLWLVVRVYTYMNATPSRTVVYEAWVEIPQHTRVKVFSTHDVALAALGNWTVTYYDYSSRPLPPVARVPGARPAPAPEPAFVGACRAMLDFPEPKLDPRFLGELLAWFGSIASCIISTTAAFLTAIVALATIVFSHVHILPVLWLTVFIYLLLTDMPRALELILKTFELIVRVMQFIVTIVVRILHALIELIPL